MALEYPNDPIAARTKCDSGITRDTLDVYTMTLRVKELQDIDPQAVPLPNGTEVTTRADRLLGDKVVKQGALGRVQKSSGTTVTVQIVGVGEVEYQRHQLAPRKAGQLRFAQRRESAWQALHSNVIIETVVGSRAWGLDDEDSDTDLRGLFQLPFSWTIGLAEAPADLVSAEGSATYWEIGKGFRQAIRADPNTLEMLMLPEAKATDEMGEWILEAKEAFVSSEIYGTFGRYALSQLERLKQSLRLAEHRDLMLEWLRVDSTLSLDEASRKLALSAQIQGNSEPEVTLRAKTYIKQLYSSLYDQGYLGSRDYQSFVVFAQEGGAQNELPRELRPKNAYNLLRLIVTATNWMTTGVPQFQIKGPMRDELWSIKRGEVALATVVARAEELAGQLEEARHHSVLPHKADIETIDALLRRLRTEAAARQLGKKEGPFGIDAALLPLSDWE